MKCSQHRNMHFCWTSDNIKEVTDYVELGNKRGSRGESATARFLAGCVMNEAEGLPNGAERD